MSRISRCFETLKNAGKQALIPYLTAGDPDIKTTLSLMHALVDAGADIIELGYPFTDPTSDGPVIQRAVERALVHNTSLKQTLETVAQFRQMNDHTPVVLMGYLNPIECMGYAHFIERAVNSGVDGVLVVDMPPEESHDFLELIRETSLDTIYLVAPTTSEERIEEICSDSSGYVYYISLKGVTGASHLDIDSVRENLAKVRQYTDLPVGVGFGIKDGETARAIAAIADAVVVGSALVNEIAKLEGQTDVPREKLDSTVAVIKAMRQAMDKE